MTEEELAVIVAEDRLIAAARPQVAVAVVAPNDRIWAIAKRWEDRIEELGWTTAVLPNRVEVLHWLRQDSATVEVDF